MQRPVYETRKSLEEEAALAQELSGMLNVALHKTAKFGCADYLAVRDGKIKGWVEVKHRRYPWHKIAQWGGLMISSVKMSNLMNLSRSSGLPVLLAVKCVDGVYILKLKDGDVPDCVQIGGRFDRDDAADIEPVMIYRASRFIRLSAPTGPQHD